MDPEEEAYRARKSRSTRDRSRDRDLRREKRRDGSTARDEDGADQRSRRRDDYERRRHGRDEDEDGEREPNTRRRRRRQRSYTRSRSPPSRRAPQADRPKKRSPSPHDSRRPRRSRSPQPKRQRRSYSQSPSHSPPPSASAPSRRARGALVSQEDSFRKEGGDSSAVALDKDGKPIEKQKPNFNATGLLAKEANTVAGTNTVLKYHEPPEARKPPSKQQWRIYVFKGKDTVDTIHLYMRSCWLIGRDEKICDYFLQHPSSSKQHAVIQFRYITKVNEYGDKEGKVKPYLIDLGSANGTRLNGKRIDASKYVELLDGDVLGFGESEREYVLMLPPA